MFIGNLKIASIDGSTVTFKDGSTVELTEKNKELLTEKASTGSDLQERMAKAVVKDVIDVYYAHNVRLVDIGFIQQLVTNVVQAKQDQTLVDAIGRKKLEALSKVFGATGNADGNTVRNIRMRDTFTS